MSLTPEFVEQLEFVHPRDIFNLLRQTNRHRTTTLWILKNEIRPVDLYCYLYARFGRPNGIQNFLRDDHSANLIHWEWFLRSGSGSISILGMNFRTEIWISSTEELNDSDKDAFIRQIKSHFPTHGAEMSKVRKSLEHWIEFVNPYERIRHAVTRLLDDLASLDLDANRDRIPDLWEQKSPEELKDTWEVQAEKYSRAIGLCFGVRSMLPVMAEAFVNLLLYILMKQNLKKDARLSENIIRQPIDVRIRSLSNNCIGFKQHVDYDNDICKRYSTLVNERNDLLHGNVVIDKLRFNDLYFNGRVPVFIQYSSMWERSYGVAHRSVGLDKIKEELTVVDDLIEYLLSCLDDNYRDKVRAISDKFDLGVCLDDGRLGILFPDWVVDFAPVFERPNE